MRSRLRTQLWARCGLIGHLWEVPRDTASCGGEMKGEESQVSEQINVQLQTGIGHERGSYGL